MKNILMGNKISFFIYFTFFIIHNCKIWTPEALSKEMRSWNSLIDPESFLIEEENFTSRINNNYLKTNKIYDKVDVNIFVIPRIPDQYAYTHAKYADELNQEIEKNTDIPSENRKTSYLTIIFILKQNNVIIRPSDKLKKMLSKDDISAIIHDTVPIIQNKNYSKAIVFLFEKLDILWKKYKKTETNKKQHSEKNMASKMENVHQMEAIVFVCFLFLIFIVFLVQRCVKKKNVKDLDHID